MKVVSSILLSCILVTSCLDKKDDSFFDELELGAAGSETRLIFYANFDECGEWGGHKEDLIIFAKSDKNFYATFKKSKVDCDKVGALYGTPEFHQPDLEKTFKLNNSHKEAIREYMQRLVYSKISEKHPGHAGQNFGIIKTDSTLIIDVYDVNPNNFKNYKELQKKLDLPITRL